MTDTTARCWGDNRYYGLLGNNSGTQSSVPVTVVDPANTANALTGIARIAAGLNHACAVLTDGTAKCWGFGYYGQLGNNTTTDSKVPVTVVDPANTANTLTGIASVSAGDSFACAVLTDGTARCWGLNIFGKLGNNTTTQSKVPVTVVDPANTANALTGIARISAGFNHACARMTDGTARCWGLNNYGNLGNNTNTQSNVPVTVIGLG